MQVQVKMFPWSQDTSNQDRLEVVIWKFMHTFVEYYCRLRSFSRSGQPLLSTTVNKCLERRVSMMRIILVRDHIIHAKSCYIFIASCWRIMWSILMARAAPVPAGEDDHAPAPCAAAAGAQSTQDTLQYTAPCTQQAEWWNKLTKWQNCTQ